ncbi:hypothetical protein A1D22_10765 [Pasteurellaceae bacterium LFhippo2]|nr:hypothetical protein [Pasteurellaceae bacterium LFhippo2]
MYQLEWASGSVYALILSSFTPQAAIATILLIVGFASLNSTLALLLGLDFSRAEFTEDCAAAVTAVPERTELTEPNALFTPDKTSLTP